MWPQFLSRCVRPSKGWTRLWCHPRWARRYGGGAWPTCSSGSTARRWGCCSPGRRWDPGMTIFLNTHLGYSLNFSVVYHCHIMGGIPPPGRGIVGKNRSTRSKTTERGQTGSLYYDPTMITFYINRIYLSQFSHICALFCQQPFKSCLASLG